MKRREHFDFEEIDREGAEVDAYLAKRQRPEMVFKVHEESQPMQQSAPTMDAETQRRWDAWCDARIEQYIDANNEVVGEFVAEHVNKKLDQLRGEIEKAFPGCLGRDQTTWRQLIPDEDAA
jgi:hypothetical protein